MIISIALDDIFQGATDIVIATQAIPIGTYITPNMVGMMPYPQHVPLDENLVITTLDDVIGQTAHNPIGIRQPVSPRDLVPESYVIPGTYLMIQPVHNRGDIVNERIVLRNEGETPFSIGNWAIRDRDDNTYTLAQDTTIAPDETLTLYTKAGQSRQHVQYMGFETAIWGDPREHITLLDSNGRIKIVVTLDDETLSD